MDHVMQSLLFSLAGSRHRQLAAEKVENRQLRSRLGPSSPLLSAMVH